MFCENCGAPLEEGARFCGNCGAPVASAAPVAREQAPRPAGKLYYPNPARYTTYMGFKERAAMLGADDTDDFPENE
jgi:predicted amidophosphoribosyltransferase